MIFHGSKLFCEVSVKSNIIVNGSSGLFTRSSESAVRKKLLRAYWERDAN